MLDFLSGWYVWIKAAHVMSIIAWMAGLFYLPRLFVYHAERGEIGSELSETLKIMEEKLLRFIMKPAMISSFFFGLLLLIVPGIIDWGSDFWVYIKIICVFGMAGFQGWLGRQAKAFQADENTLPGRSYRIANEIPTFLMVVIVIMVIVKPI